MTPTSFFPPSATWACRGLLLVAILAATTAAVPVSHAAPGPRVLSVGQLPGDVRLEPLKDLDGYFPFTPAPNRQAWDQRAERVRRQMLVSLGLWPMPAKTPLQPVVHGQMDRGDYTVEKVYFESIPGFYVTGNLYRPKNRAGKVPGVLCPHGHWSNGRFTDAGEEGVRREIVQGAERFEEGGRSPLQARCMQWDMIGYADSVQIPSEIAHGFSKQRPEMSTTENWGLFSPQAEAHFQSVMGLQTWNSIRSLDFLLSLPEVDATHIAVTGASGGGTQTFILCAIDPRPALAFPAVMVSTAMQGGCTCENACDLRIGTGNVEFAALFAPKPLGLTAADDWTKEMPTKGYPELQQHYAMLEAKDRVLLKALVHFGHNYNYVSRAAMYSWINKQFQLGLKEPILEGDYQRLTRQEMSVWDEQHPKPPGGPDFERQLLRRLTDDAARQLADTPRDREAFQKTVGGAVDVIIGRNLAESGAVEWAERASQERDGFVQVTGVLRNTTHREELPVVILRPAQKPRRAVLWISGEGKAGLFAPGAGRDSQPKPEIQRLLGAGFAVVGADLLYQGEFLADGQPVTQTGRVKNPREAAAYTFGYNHTLFAQRVHDILSLVQWLRQPASGCDQVHLVGLDGAGPWVAAARAQAGAAVQSAVIDTGAFRFGKVLDIHDRSFLPGGAKYFDLPGLIALHAPGRLFLAGEGEKAPEVVATVYQAAGAADRLTVFGGESARIVEAAVAWLSSGISP
jgi:dienelactone hydrolase